MIIFYFLFFMLMIYIFKKYNYFTVLILGILSLTFLLNDLKFIPSFSSIIQDFIDFFNNSDLLIVFLVLISTFIIFDLLAMFNFNYNFEKSLDNMKVRQKRIYLALLSIFSSNIDFTNTKIDVDEKTNFKLNSIITPFINILSIPFLFVFISIYSIINIEIPPMIIFISVFINITVFLWIILQFISLSSPENNHYEIDNNTYNKLIPKVDIFENENKPIKIPTKNKLITLGIFVVVSVIIFTFAIPFNIFTFIFVMNIHIIGLLISHGETLAFKKKYFNEINLINTIYNSAKVILFELAEIVISLIFIATLYKVLKTFDLFNNSFNFIFLITIIILSFLATKNYKFTTILTVPILATLINSSTFVDIETLYLYIFISCSIYVSSLTYMQLISVIKKRELNYIQVISLVGIIMIEIIIYGLILKLNLLSIIFALIGIFIILIIYVLFRIVRIYNKVEK